MQMFLWKMYYEGRLHSFNIVAMGASSWRPLWTDCFWKKWDIPFWPPGNAIKQCLPLASSNKSPFHQVRRPIRAAVRPASAAVSAAVWPGWTRKSTTHRRRSSAPSWAPTWPCPAPRRSTIAPWWPPLAQESGLASPTSSPRASSSAPTAAASCRPTTRPGPTASPTTT